MLPLTPSFPPPLDSLFSDLVSLIRIVYTSMDVGSMENLLVSTPPKKNDFPAPNKIQLAWAPQLVLGPHKTHSVLEGHGACYCAAIVQVAVPAVTRESSNHVTFSRIQ